MTDKSLDKALDIVSILINGGEIRKDGGSGGLYEEYAKAAEVYDKIGRAHV